MCSRRQCRAMGGGLNFVDLIFRGIERILETNLMEIKFELGSGFVL